jgi:AcrR family transcriptional regulator
VTIGQAARERAGGRPRNPELDRAILDAVLQLLADEGYERMSIESVAQRAGVGKPTIYRRWPSKAAMVVDAVAQLAEVAPPPASVGSVRERVHAFVEQAWRKSSQVHDDRTTVLSHLLGEIHHNADLREAVRTTFVANRRAQLRALLEEGVRTGEVRPDVDLDVATDVLFSPLLARKLITGGKISTAVARTVVDLVFDGCATRSS